MITGKEKPDSGTIKIGETVKLAYADQTRTLDPEKTVYEEISQGADFLELGKRKDQRARILFLVQLRRRRPAKESRRALRR